MYIMSVPMYRDPYVIDFSNMKTHWEIHQIIKEGLDFPDYYGCNWDAFWDCLTDMVGRKIHIQIVGIDVLRRGYDDTAEKMLEILQEFKYLLNHSLYISVFNLSLIRTLDKVHQDLLGCPNV